MTEGPRRYATSVAEIADLLAGQIEALCAELLPAGRRDGAEWCVGSTAGEAGQSLRVHLRGARRGVWCDFSSADRRDRGDALDLVAACLFAGDKRQALRWSRGWLGLAADHDHTRMATRRPEPVRKHASERDDEGKRQSAIRLWLEASESIRGTPAAAYLAGRGLDLARLGRVPRALRFHPGAICAEMSCARTGEKIRMPAMLAAITDAAGRHIATHRTYLAQHDGAWSKARLRAPKKVLGGYVGGSIRLWRGASGKPLAQAPAGDEVAIAEGIEDALTVALACPEWRVLAAVSVSNFANIDLPPQCLNIWLICDRDGFNPQADGAREKAVRRWQEEGRRVREARPPDGHKDFNDWWQAQTRRQGRGERHD